MMQHSEKNLVCVIQHVALLRPKVDQDGYGVGEAVLLKVLDDAHHDRVKVVLLDQMGAVWVDHGLVGKLFHLEIRVEAVLRVPLLSLLILLHGYKLKKY